MRQIRHGVFETNSSSTHSVTVRQKGLQSNYMKIHSDGYIHTELGEFGWEIESYDGQEDKLSYLVTMLAEKNGGADIWWRSDKTRQELVQDLMKTKDFKRISKEIGTYAKCEGVIIDPSSGYIDHQSHEEYATVQEFLNDYRIDAVEFVFGRGVVLHTDNDNH